MSALLLDTQALVFALSKPRALPASARRAVTTAETVHYSAAALWEIMIKREKLGSRSGLRLDATSYRDAATRTGFQLLPLDAQDVFALRTVRDWKHKDPFDRIMVATARNRQLSLVTGDENIRAYLHGTIW